jgi:hypothetical protein
VKFGVLNLQLIVDLFFVEKFSLHLLYLVEVALNERDILLGIEIFDLKLYGGV